MMKLSAELRSKPGWWALYKDKDVIKQWTKDVLRKTWSVGPASNNIRVGLGRHQVRR